MPSNFEGLNGGDVDRPPWSFEVASERARNLAKKLNVSIYLVPIMGDYGKVKWGISRESDVQREEYAVARDEELKKLHPERYPPPLTPEQQRKLEAQEWQENRDAEISRLWEHDNPGLRDLYYPSNFPVSFFAEDDE